MNDTALRTTHDYARFGYTYLTGSREKRKEFFDFIKNQIEKAINEGKTETPGSWLSEIITVVERSSVLVSIPEEASRDALKWIAENLSLILECARVSRSGIGRRAPLFILTKYLPEIYKKGLWKPRTFSTPLDAVILIYETLRFEDKYGRTDDGAPFSKALEVAKKAVLNWGLTRLLEKAVEKKFSEEVYDENVRKVVSEWAVKALGMFEENRSLYEPFIFALMIDGTELIVKGKGLDDYINKDFDFTLQGTVKRNVKEGWDIIAGELDSALRNIYR